MMGVAPKGLRHDLLELGLDRFDGLARRQPGAVADAKDVSVDRERLLAERGVQHDIGGFSPDAGEGLQFLAGAGNLAVMPVDQRLA